jgi:putative endonuclease
LEFRFQEHINKTFKGRYTTKYEDWELYLEIRELEYQQARNIEKHIKILKSKKYIRDLRKYEELRNKLIEKYKTYYQGRGSVNLYIV